MNLVTHSADSRPIVSYQDKKVLYYEAISSIFINNFHMCQSLLIGTNFISALDNEKTFFSENTTSFPSRLIIQPQDRLMIFFTDTIPRLVIPVITFVVLMIDVCSTSRCTYVSGIKNYTIKRRIGIRQPATIHPLTQITGQEPIHPGGDPLPEHTFAIGYVRNSASGSDVQRKNIGENQVAGPLICMKINSLVARPAATFAGVYAVRTYPPLLCFLVGEMYLLHVRLRGGNSPFDAGIGIQ